MGHVFRNLAVGVTGIGLVAGVGLGVTIQQDKFPALTRYDSPPPRIPDNPVGFVCAAPPDPCTPATRLAEFGGTQHVTVPLDKISPFFLKVLVAAEDKRFYQHDGVDKHAIKRALWMDFWAQDSLEGASTITMQAAKAIYPKPTDLDLTSAVGGETAKSLGFKVPNDFKKLAEKAHQARLALTMEADLTEKYTKQFAKDPSVTPEMIKHRVKDKVLEEYANNVYEGRGAKGVEEAARAYFGKSAKDLTLQESIVLVANLTGPSSSDVSVLLSSVTPAIAKHYEAFTQSMEQAEKDGVEPGPAYKKLIEDTKASGEEPTYYQKTLSAVVDAVASGQKNAREAKQLNDYAYYVKEKDLLKERYDGVINKLRAQNIISKEEAETLKNTDVMLKGFKPRPQGGSDENAIPLYARQFVEMAKNEAAQKTHMSIGQLAAGGYKIYTTLNPKYQQIISGVVSREIPLRQSNIDMSVTRIASDGAITGMVAGKNPRSQLNLANRPRNVGSRVKPFILAEALRRGAKLNDTFSAKLPVTLSGQNGSQPLIVKKGSGCSLLRPPKPEGCRMSQLMGLAVSSDSGAALNAQKVGLKPVVATMRQFGEHVKPNWTASLALGTELSQLDQTVGYNNLVAKQGAYAEPYSVIKVASSDGKTIPYERKQVAPKQIIKRSIALDVTKAMIGVVQFGTASVVETPRGQNSTAGKTGTWGIGKDNFALGFTAVTCDAKYGTADMSVDVANPAGDTPITAYKNSGSMARVWNKIDQRLPHSPAPCSLLTPLP